MCAVHDSQTAVLLLRGGAGGGTIVAAHSVKICELTHTLISLQHSLDPSIVSFHGPTLIKFQPAIPKRHDFMRRCDRATCGREVVSWSRNSCSDRAKIKIKNHRIPTGVGPKPMISLRKCHSGSSPGTPRGRGGQEKNKNHVKQFQDEDRNGILNVSNVSRDNGGTQPPHFTSG